MNTNKEVVIMPNHYQPDTSLEQRLASLPPLPALQVLRYVTGYLYDDPNFWKAVEHAFGRIKN